LLAATLPAMAVTVARAQSGALAAPDYPNHQVTFIVPFTPAGGTDVLARLLAEKLEQ
jgi:tripartite-type tricarboxylate transporter receptor subunit TctC